MDKFEAYYNSEEKIQELSQYVHENVKLIHTKMLSEMRKKLDITPDPLNSDGYISLMVSLYGRMFNELVYGLAGISQFSGVAASEIISPSTITIFRNLMNGENHLKGLLRTDVEDDIDGFRKFYLENINDLRKYIGALPK